jgi:phosphoribosylformimino-5-aminoimidazole carboxamide ribotide isomerase
MTKFRPCIDLHEGKVKQIVGGTLSDRGERPTENFVASTSADWFATKYAADELDGGHVIKLGPGNDAAAKAALSAYPEGMQLGGGVNAENAAVWLDAGASHVIVTSWLFNSEGIFLEERAARLAKEIGKQNIVIDLSCRKIEGGWQVAMNRWQTRTNLSVNETVLDALSEYCGEFLIHAADVEGLCEGIDEELVSLLGRWGKIPMTYAGGVANMTDVELVANLSDRKVDVTVGSALDLFGGQGVNYEELIEWSHRQE